MIDKKYYDELKTIHRVTKKPLVLDWFNYIHKHETYGWRTKQMTQRIAKILSSETPRFYALFCPSYIKGEGKFGIRTDDVGNTTTDGLNVLKKISDDTYNMGFRVGEPLAIYFDIAVEQPDRAVPEDMEKNIENFKKHLPEGVVFKRLTDVFPFLKDVSGWYGFKNNKLPIANTLMDRIVERGKKFYSLFGWTDAQIKDRTETIVSVESFVGKLLRDKYPTGIMLYTPTMLERAYIYSPDNETLPMIFMKHGGL